MFFGGGGRGGERGGKEARQLLKHPFFEQVRPRAARGRRLTHASRHVAAAPYGSIIEALSWGRSQTQVRAEQLGGFGSRCKPLQPLALAPAATSQSSLPSPQSQPPTSQTSLAAANGHRGTPPPSGALAHSHSAAALPPGVAAPLAAAGASSGGDAELGEGHGMVRAASITLAQQLPSAVQGRHDAYHQALAQSGGGGAAGVSVPSGLAGMVAASPRGGNGAPAPLLQSSGSLAPSAFWNAPQQQTIELSQAPAAAHGPASPTKGLPERPSQSDLSMAMVAADGPSFAAYLLPLQSTAQLDAGSGGAAAAGAAAAAAAASLAQQAIAGAASVTAAAAAAAGAPPARSGGGFAASPSPPPPLVAERRSGGGAGAFPPAPAPAAPPLEEHLADLAEDVLLYSGGESRGNSAATVGASGQLLRSVGSGGAPPLGRSSGEGDGRRSGGGGGQGMLSPMLANGGGGVLVGSESGGSGGGGATGSWFSPTHSRASAGRGRVSALFRFWFSPAGCVWGPSRLTLTERLKLCC